MADLKTTYKDDLLDTSVNEKRKYNMIQNADGTVSFEDVTTYSQIGDSFGAADINATNKKVNEVNSNLGGFEFRLNEGNKEVSTDGGTTWENFSQGAELLWENSAPSSEWTASTIALDLSNYEAIMVESALQTAHPHLRGVAYMNVDNSYHQLFGENPNTQGASYRRCKVTTSGLNEIDTTGIYSGSSLSSFSKYSGACIPCKIYGLKNKII